LSTHFQPSETSLSSMTTDIFFAVTASGRAERSFACSA
jgi:hypothetical protein